MIVTAIFDNVDSAEHALTQLRAQGFALSRCKIQRLKRPHRPQTDSYALPGPFFWEYPGGLNLSAPFFSNSLLNTGGLTEQALERQGAGQEALLQLDVADRDARALQSALISCHGRRVRSYK